MTSPQYQLRASSTPRGEIIAKFMKSPHSTKISILEPVRFPRILRFSPVDNQVNLNISDRQHSWTSGTDFRRHVPDRLPFFSGTGGGNSSPKIGNQGISDFSRLHVCLRLAGIQNLSFFFKFIYGISRIFTC